LFQFKSAEVAAAAAKLSNFVYDETPINVGTPSSVNNRDENVDLINNQAE